MPRKPLNGPDNSHQSLRRPLEELQATALLREGKPSNWIASGLPTIEQEALAGFNNGSGQIN